MLLVTLASGCDKKTTSPSPSDEDVLVLRVEAPSPEEPGAEHCETGGKNCQPLAARQRVPAQGIIRTFAGGRVSLDFGDGRRIDLDSLSQVELAPQRAKLQRGDFTVDSVPLIDKEDLTPLVIETSGTRLSGRAHTPTRLALSVRGEETLATVHRGEIEGLPVEGHVAHAGQSIRIFQAQAFRTSQEGGELPSLRPLLVDPLSEGLIEAPMSEKRGLGTMTARLPNTDQLRQGVHLKRHHVKVVIRDGYARTEVEEEFENTTPHILEGRYLFSVPPDATVSRLALWVDDRLMEGEVLERDRAARIYDSIVDRPVPRDPALLEWKSGGALSLKVFPILPQKTRKVIVAYDQALSAEGGILRYVYPLSLGEGKETSIEDFSLSVQLNDQRALTDSLRVDGYDVEQGQEGSWQTVTLSKKNFVPRRDFALSVRRGAGKTAELASFTQSMSPTIDPRYGDLGLPSSFESGAAQPPADQTGHFALRVSADLPPGAPRPAPRKVDRAIVLDVSHSQSAASIRAQGALALSMVRDLAQDENYVLLACDSACTSLSSRRDAGSESTLSSRLQETKVWLEALHSGGSSDMGGAIMAAASHLARLSAPGREHRPQLVLLHDGNVSSGELSASAISARVIPLLEGSEIDLRLVGVGRTVDHGLLTQLAAKLNAPVDFLQGDDFSSRMFELTIGLRKPVIRGVSVHLPPHLRPSQSFQRAALRLGQELILTGRVLPQQAPSTESLTLVGNLEGTPYHLERAVAHADGALEQNPLVVRLWARDLIAELSESEQNPAIRKEIVAISTRFRTMSRYTSFLVLESEKMYADFGVARGRGDASERLDEEFLALPRSDALEAPPPGGSLESRLLEDSAPLPENSAPLPDAARRASAPPPQAAPKSTSSARPRPASKSSASAEATLDLFAGRGSGAAPLERARESAPAARPPRTAPSPSDAKGGISSPDPMLGWPEGADTESMAPAKRRYPAHRPTSHLRITQADGAWRNWGETQRKNLLDQLARTPDSRAALEEGILGLLKLGRFSEAHRIAQRYFELDPDNEDPQLLLAYAGAVDGDHELSRKMLDVRTETTPKSAEAHLQAGRSFLAVRDDVRACAHFRSYAEIVQNENASRIAENCWKSLTTKAGGRFSTDGLPEPRGHIEVEVQCDDTTAVQDCPSPLLLTPSGQVLSPWTPGPGKSTRSLVTAVKIRSGDYFVLVAGGSPASRGRVFIRGKSTSQSLAFESGAQHTVARIQASYW